jgi:hypothetical protein
VHGNLPDWVRELRVETGHDASGDPALWVWVEVDDAASTDAGFTMSVKQIKTLLENAVRTISPDRWPYVRFRTVSEQEAM